MTAQGAHVEDLLEEVKALRREVKLLRGVLRAQLLGHVPPAEVEDVIGRALGELGDRNGTRQV